MRLHRHGHGPPKVVALHGFTQHGGHFGEIATHLGASTMAPDLPGHGPEPHLPATMDEAVARVVDLLDDTGATVLLGYSMGGRVALRVALVRPPELLVLVSTTAGITDHRVRAARSVADGALADDLERDGLEAFVDRWSNLPMFAGLAARSPAWRAHDRALRLEHDTAALAASLRGMGQGATEPVADADLAGLGVPTVLLTGAADPPYAAEAERLGAVLPVAMVETHPTAGHALIGEDPGWVAMQVQRRF